MGFTFVVILLISVTLGPRLSIVYLTSFSDYSICGCAPALPKPLSGNGTLERRRRTCSTDLRKVWREYQRTLSLSSIEWILA